MKLVLVRHTSVDVPPAICYGQTDVPLKESFHIEADKVKTELNFHINDINEKDNILCSP